MSFLRLHPLQAAACLGLGLAACGAEPHIDTLFSATAGEVTLDATGTETLPTLADVQVWDGTDTLAKNKAAVVAAAKKVGLSDEQTRLVIAIGMAETNEMNPADRDVTKDNMGPAKNFSAFNMNGDMLGRLGWAEGSGPDLNDAANVEPVVALLKKAFDTFGTEGFLCFHRGGATALADKCSYGAQTYVHAMQAVAEYLKSNPADLTSKRRVGMQIQHV